jgi:hypothetical protein
MRTKLLRLAIIGSIFLTALAANAQVIRGYTGAQVFSNCGGPDPAEPICGVNGSAQLLVTFLPEETGVLYMNTDGSNFDTVMAAFIRSPTNPAVLKLVGCDNNSGLDGQDSALQIPVVGGQTNIVFFAGVNGACGTLHFNFTLVAPSRLTPLPRSPSGQFKGRVTGHAGMRFVIDASPSLISSNLTIWNPILTNTAPAATFDFTDTTSPIPSRRYYRARMLP